MVNVLLVGCGGFVGSALRYLLSSWVTKVVAAAWLPAGTLAVNLIGCFVLGLLGGMAEHRQLLSNEMRLLLMTGLLGGFTTFSTFGLESHTLIRTEGVWPAFAYIGISVVIGVLLAWLGYVIPTKS